jgi:hypothetical protein
MTIQKQDDLRCTGTGVADGDERQDVHDDGHLAGLGLANGVSAKRPDIRIAPVPVHEPQYRESASLADNHP